jgi:chromosome segregation and condensation protein ScpB
VLGFRVVEQPHAPSDDSRSPLERVQGVLAAAPQPVTQRQLRQAVRMRASLVADVLEQLIADGRVSHGPDGYRLTL